jgi:hypothetical protein
VQPSTPYGRTIEFSKSSTVESNRPPDSDQFEPSSVHRPSREFVASEEVRRSTPYRRTIEFSKSSAVESNRASDSGEFDHSSVHPASREFEDSEVRPSVSPSVSRSRNRGVNLREHGRVV